MPNLPLDANDEDILQRGLRRPSLDDTLLPVNETFTAVKSQYDNFAPGIVSTDNIWPLKNASELANLTSAQRREFLEQRGLAPPADSIPLGQELSGLDQIVQDLGNPDGSVGTQQLAEAGLFTEKLDNIQSKLDAALANGGNIPTDSYGQVLQGPTTQPLPVTTPPPGGSYNPPGTQPQSSSNSVYNYTPIELYNDRYDFLTGQIIRKGIATGAKGGVGSEDSPGNTITSQGPSVDQQTEASLPPANVGPNDTSTETLDDANTTESALSNRLDSQGTPSSRLDGKDGDLYSPKPEGRLSNRLDSKGETPPPPPPPKLSSKLDTKGSHRASRNEIIASRRQSGSDIKFARANGETLVRHRRPDGTYYAGPPKKNRNKQLPQRARDLGF